MRTNFTHERHSVSSRPILRIGIASGLIAMFCAFNVMAQDRTISGTVVGEESGESLPGVNVILKGTTQGTVTDIEGNYSLSVPEGAETLSFSFIGYATQEVPINGQSTIDIQLISDTQQLSEVVVTALGIVREERSLGYSTQSVESEELNATRQANVVSALAGKVAGVQINGANGGLGSSSRITIRGINSISGGNEPLFIVDGVPMDNSNYTDANQKSGRGGYDYGNFAQDISPDDIASINVLKGPSAAALYGNRAANGVILITTKSGKGKQGIGVSVNASVTLEEPYLFPDYQNLYGGGAGPFGVNDEGQAIVRYDTDASWGPRLDGRPVRQWYSYYEDSPDFGKETPWLAHPGNVEDFFETGVTFNNNIALTGGNDKSSFRLSYTNVSQKGILPVSNLNRNSINFKGSSNLTDKLNVSAGIIYTKNAIDGVPGTGYDGVNVMQQFSHFGQRQVDMGRLKNYQTADGTQRGWNLSNAGNGYELIYSNNPYWVRHNYRAISNRDRLIGNVDLSYEFTDWLTFSAGASTDYYTDRRENYVAEGSAKGDRPFNYTEGIREYQENNYKFLFLIDKNITEQFSLGATFGGNMLDRTYFRNEGTTVDGLQVPGVYTITNSVGRPNIDDYKEAKKINSLFASATLGYMDMFYLDATLRNDWSSTLPTDNNSYLYPSVSGSVVFSEFGGLANSNIISFGKLRGGWAQAGNDTDPYRLGINYVGKQPFGSNPNYAVPVTLNNAELKNETTNSWEVGAEVRFLSDRIGVDVTYYSKVTNDQIIVADVSPSSGYWASVLNAGEITNKGWEALLNVTPVSLDNGFRWDLTVNWSKNVNEVVALAPGLDTYVLGSAPFQSGNIVAEVGKAYGTITGFGFARDASGNKLIDADGFYMKTEELVDLGTILPDWIGGISNTFSYGGLSLGFLVDAQKGGSLFSVSNLWGRYSGMFEETAANNIREVGVIAEGVKEDGSPNDVVIRAEEYWSQTYQLDEAEVFDASYIKLREVKFGYALPTSIVDRTPFENITFSLIGRNLAVLFRNSPNIDPETTLSSSNLQGIEAGQLPTARSWGFNLQVDL